jgi:serine/threonine protein phosphatase PrpC
VTERDDAWWPHENGRWIVGDPGHQPQTVLRPAEIAPGRADTTFDGARLADIEYRAVSLRGLSHAAGGDPRQDAYLLRITANRQWLVGCVADGVSQPKYSHMAADIACREITRHIAEALDDQPAVGDTDDWRKLAAELPWQRAVDQASAAIVAKASAGLPRPENGEPPDADTVRRTMATTAVGFAVGVMATVDGLVPYTVAVASGDSSALVLSHGRWFPITAVKNAGSDLVSNAVLALPRAVEVAPVSGVLQPGAALVVVTDGIGDPMGMGTGEVGRFLAAQWSRPPELFAFAAHAAFYRRGFADDRTAVVVWHQPAAEPPPAPSSGSAAEAVMPGDPIALAIAEFGEAGGA